MHMRVRDKEFYRFWSWLQIVYCSCLAVGGILVIRVAMVRGGEKQPLLYAVGGSVTILAALRIFNSAAILRKLRSPKLNRLNEEMPISSSIQNPSRRSEISSDQ
jgi:hypothetical protein